MNYKVPQGLYNPPTPDWVAEGKDERKKGWARSMKYAPSSEGATDESSTHGKIIWIAHIDHDVHVTHSLSN
jgi:hypothetical protein